MTDPKLPIPELAGLDREQLRHAVYRRVFGEADPVKVGRYTVLERIGSGGMGVVFKAYDTQLDRKVAVKVIHPGQTDRALVKEAQALAKLSHPNVVHVYEVGEADRRELFLAMEFVDGPTLRGWVTAKRRRWSETMERCLEAGEGLAAAHRVGLVHRDFKPENVMVGEDGRARVLDFGLARSGPPQAAKTASSKREWLETLATTMDRGDGIAGTPAYMAPEQLAAAQVTPATDQFAFCATVFEALYGVRPFRWTNLAELIEAVEGGQVQVPKERCGVPGAIHRALLRGLQPDPAKRYPSMQVLLGELRGARRIRKVWRWAPAAAALLATAAGTGTVLYLDHASVPVATADVSAVAQRRADEVVLVQAMGEVDDDPTLALQTLTHMAQDSELWDDPRTRGIADHAEAVSSASAEIQLDRSLRFLKIVGGRALVQKRENNTVFALDLDNPEAKLTPAFEVPEYAARYAVRVSDPAGRYVIYHGPEERTLADLETGTTRTLESAGPYHFSPEGSLLAQRISGEIVVTRSADGSEVFSVPAGPDTKTVALDSGRIAVGGRDEELRVIDFKTGETVELPVRRARAKFVPGRPELITGGKGVDRWNLDIQQREQLLAEDEAFHVGHVGGAQALAFSSDTTVVIDLESLRVRRWEDATAAGMSADGRWLVFRDKNDIVSVVDLDNGRERVLTSKNAAEQTGFTSAGLALYDDAHRLRTWSLDPGIPGLHGHGIGVRSVTFGPDGTVYSGGRDRTVRSWDLATGESRTLGTDVGEVAFLRVSPDGKTLASRTHGGTVTARAVEDGKVIGTLADGHRAMEFLADGSMLLLTKEESLKWTPGSDAPTEFLPAAAGCLNLAVSPSGKRVAAACGIEEYTSERITLWDVETREEVARAELPGYSGFVFYGGDDRIIARAHDEPVLAHDFTSGKSWQVDFETGFGWADTTKDATITARVLYRGGVTVQRLGGPSIRFPSTEMTEGYRLSHVALSDDGALLASAPTSDTILIRRRTVPADADGVRGWVERNVSTKVQIP